MFAINVVNKRKHASTPHDFYCGRPSPLGNDYSHIPKGTLAKFVVKDRDESIRRHREDFLEQMETEGPVKAAFLKIYDHLVDHKIVYLICWCAPQSCHCDTIKEELLKKLASTGLLSANQ